MPGARGTEDEPHGCAINGLQEHARAAAIENALLTAVWSKQKGHGITSADFVQPARPMSAIGG